MIDYTRRIRNREIISKIFAYIVLFWGLAGVCLQTARSLLGVNPLAYTLITYFYFTTQSNILVIIVSLIFLFKEKKGKHFASLSFITLINISVTGIIFHTLLTPYMDEVTFLNHILHTIVPILYFIFYFISIKTYLPVHKFWVSLIYPLSYMIFVYMIVEPIFGNLMDSLMETFDNARYVYPFLDPNNYQNGVLGLLLFNLGLLAPIIALFSFVLCRMKYKFEQKINTF